MIVVQCLLKETQRREKLRCCSEIAKVLILLNVFQYHLDNMENVSIYINIRMAVSSEGKSFSTFI